ncbi:YtxH domain-containing protein [Marivirga salinae]|uniref:YtxH domain-containing protein n=1 Tax=Marivirga salinarum TaxID=3059078 RepID=A0AA49GAU9_9BACT|nr:YtxH domain-containing protein [Marivirga sp. BDSF4-3]WKK76985.2 YtxH domain-containing protein [Marivirga sp. BDSF4-3]
MNTAKTILGIVAGITTGAVIGVLFAPEKGRDTRRKMIKRSTDLSDAIDKRIESKFEEYERKLDEMVKDLTGRISPLTNTKDEHRKKEHVN